MFALCRHFGTFGPHRDALVGFSAMRISQFKKIAAQVWQTQHIMHPPVRSRASLLLDRGGIHHPHAPLGTDSPHDFGFSDFSHLRSQPPQPRLAGAQPLEQSDIRDVGDGLLMSPRDGLPEETIRSPYASESVATEHRHCQCREPGAAHQWSVPVHAISWGADR